MTKITESANPDTETQSGSPVATIYSGPRHNQLADHASQTKSM